MKWDMYRTGTFLLPKACAMAFLGVGWILHAADITWRGGTSEAFADRRNWGLPSDLPGGLTPAQAEAFRRVPGAIDRAIIPSGFTVRVTGPIEVRQAECSGKLVIDGASASFSSRHPTESVIDAYRDLEVRNGGSHFVANLAQFSGVTRIEGGGLLDIDSGALMEQVIVTGAPEGGPGFGQTRIRGGRTEETAVLIRDSLAIDGEVRSRVGLDGFITVLTEATWRNCRVSSSGVGGDRGRVQIGDPESGVAGASSQARLRLLGGGAGTVWAPGSDSALTFGPGAALLHGPDGQGFTGNVFFGLGSRGIPRPEPSAGTIDFGEGEFVFVGNGSLEEIVPALELSGPVRFQSGAKVRFAAPPTGLGGESVLWLSPPDAASGRHVIEVGNGAVLDLEARVGAEGVRLTGNGTVNIRPNGHLRIRPISVTNRAELVADGGRVNGHLLIDARAVFRIGKVEPFVGFVPEFRFNGVLENRGDIEFDGPPGSPSLRPQLSGIAFNHPGASLTVHGGYGPNLALPFALINFSQVTARPPRGAMPPGSGTNSAVATTLINDGHVVVESGAVMEVVEGDHFGNGVLDVETGAALAVVGQGLNDEFVWTDPLGNLRTNRLGKLFNFRANARDVLFADNSRLELRGQGSFGSTFDGALVTDVPSGIRLERQLVVPHLIMGGPSFHKPRVAFGTNAAVQGSALVISRRLDWFGGAFVGNGEGTNPSTANVELPTGSRCRITFEPTDPISLGAIHHLGGGISIHCFGDFEVLTGNAIRRQDGTSQIVLHPGPDAVVQGMTAFDNGNAGWLNRRTVRKQSTRSFVVSGPWTNEGEGRVVIEEGEFIVRKGTLGGGGFEVAVTGASFRTEEATLRNFTATGAPLDISRATRFAGRNTVDFLTVGNGISAESVLNSEPGTTIEVVKGMTWRSNGIRLTPDSTIELGRDSLNRIESTRTTTPAGIWESGKIVNKGQLTVVANDLSKFFASSSTTGIENQGVLILDATAGGQLFAGDNRGFPGGCRLVNRGELRIRVNTRQFDIAPMFFNEDGGTVEVEDQDGNGPGRLSPGPNRPAGPAAPNPPNLGQIVFLDEFTLNGGECDFRRTDVTFNDVVRITDGTLVLGGNGDGVFKAVLEAQTGELRFEEPAFGRFERATVFRQGAQLGVGRSSRLEAPRGLRLLDGARLSGLGRFVGNVVNTSGVIAPGDDRQAVGGRGPLIVQGSVAFGSGATLEVDVGTAPDPAPQDRLEVVGILATEGTVNLAGTLKVNPVFNGDELNTGFIPVLSHVGEQTGDFPFFQTVPFGETLRFAPLEKPELKQLGVVIVADGNSDLALSADVPLTAPTDADVTLRFRVENRGPADGDAARLEITLPENATLVESTPPGTTTAGKLTVAIPALGKDARTDVVVKLRTPDSAGPMRLMATVLGSRPDPAPANNTVNATTAVLAGGEFRVAKFELNPAGSLRLTFDALAGVRYRVERSTDLQTWEPHGELLGDGTPRQVDPAVNAGGTPSFFRLLVIR